MHDIRSQSIYYLIKKIITFFYIRNAISCKALVVFSACFTSCNPRSKTYVLWHIPIADQPTIPPFLQYSHLSIRPSSFLKENNGSWRNQIKFFPPFSPWAATAWMKSHAATWLHSVKSTISSNPAKVNAQQRTLYWTEINYFWNV